MSDGATQTPTVKRASRSLQLYVGGDWDLVEEYARLEAERASPSSLAGVDRSRLDEVGRQIAAGTITFRLQALGRVALQRLMDRHPPRQDNKQDQALGFNEDTATDELLRKCIVEPTFSDTALTQLLEDDLSDGQYEQLSAAAWGVNRRAVPLPLSLAVSMRHPITGDE